ncbi:hypothetical protein V3W47_12240 [Deinococcus sp. YIM 134068]|uniref:hypothetical protein n=1 Tax=Deinococcus lichenicola TaxID=3118910 RepID=UPI002F921BCD
MAVTVKWLTPEQAHAGPRLTLTPGGNTSMALRGGTLYVRPRPGAGLTACDHDRAAALGHVFEGEAAPWSSWSEATPSLPSAPTRDPRATLMLGLHALLPGYTWDVQAGPPDMPLLISADSAEGAVTVRVTHATYRRHRTSATLVCDIAEAVQRRVEREPVSLLTL